MPKNSWSKNSLWLYTIILKSLNEKKRDKLIKKLSEIGIETRPGFYPLNTMDPYKKYSRGLYPITNKISYCSLSLPSTPSLSRSKILYI